MRLDRVFADVEGARDLFIALSCRCRSQRLSLAPREARFCSGAGLGLPFFDQTLQCMAHRVCQSFCEENILCGKGIHLVAFDVNDSNHSPIGRQNRRAHFRTRRLERGIVARVGSRIANAQRFCVRHHPAHDALFGDCHQLFLYLVRKAIAAKGTHYAVGVGESDDDMGIAHFLVEDLQQPAQIGGSIRLVRADESQRA